MPRKPKFTIQPVERSEIQGIEREILGKTMDDGVYPLSMAKEIRLDRIQPDPDQPRRSMDPESLEGLAASIRQEGVLQPIVVHYVEDGAGGYFMLTHGERRWRAAQMAGLETIPAIIREDTDDTTRLVRQLMENIQREDLNAVDRASALQGLKDHLGNPSWETVAGKVGIKRSRLFQLLDVMKQPEEVQADIRAGRLTEKHSRALQRAPEPVREELRQAILREDLSTREAMTIAREAQDIFQEEEQGPPGWTVDQAVIRLREKPRPEPKPESRMPILEAPAAESPPGWTTEDQRVVEAHAEGMASPVELQIAPADPLAALTQLGDALGAIDLTQADPAPLQALLQAIIAKASALLEQLAEAVTASERAEENESQREVPSRREEVAEVESDPGEPPTPTDDLT